VPGKYTFVLKVSDDCSSAEDTLILYAKCMQKVTAKIVANATDIVSCTKDDYTPVSLTGNVVVERTSGVDVETTCAVTAAASAPPAPPAVVARCCPPCAVCPTCPRGMFQKNASECAAPICPACDCPPTAAPQAPPAPSPPFRRRTGLSANGEDQQHVPFEEPVFTPPNWNPPPSLFSQPSGVARAIAVGHSEGHGAALKRAESVSLTILVNADLDTIAATEEHDQSFRAETRDFVARSSQVPLSSVRVVSVEGHGNQVAVTVAITLPTAEKPQAVRRLAELSSSQLNIAGYVVDGIVSNDESEDAAASEFVASTAAYTEDNDSRERVLWMAAVLPASILLVASIATNVVVIGHYSKVAKQARFVAVPS